MSTSRPKDEGLLLSDEHLSRLLGKDAEVDVRSTASSLESWHWGNLRSDKKATARNQQRNPLTTEKHGSPAPKRNPDFGGAAVIQSGVYLPESETPGISPARDWGSSIPTSPLTAAVTRARRYTLTNAQVSALLPSSIIE